MSGDHRKITVAAVQTPPASTDIQKNVERMLHYTEEAAQKGARIVGFCELGTTPYMCYIHNSSFFDWAQKIPGPITEAFGEKAKELGIYIVLTMYEKGELEGEYYNSAVLIGPGGKIIEGERHDGAKAKCYRKVHIPIVVEESDDPKAYHPGRLRIDEKYYFKPGPGFVVFRLPEVTLGILICYDKRFSEAWRILTLMGAEVIFYPLSTFAGWKAQTGTFELRTYAINHGLFIVCANRSGKERLGNEEREFAGDSSIIAPDGEILAQASDQTKPEVLVAEIDLEEVKKERLRFPILRDRRPELYGLLTKI